MPGSIHHAGHEPTETPASVVATPIFATLVELDQNLISFPPSGRHPKLVAPPLGKQLRKGVKFHPSRRSRPVREFSL